VRQWKFVSADAIADIEQPARAPSFDRVQGIARDRLHETGRESCSVAFDEVSKRRNLRHLTPEC
jgi:hypothetical protein